MTYFAQPVHLWPFVWLESLVQIYADLSAHLRESLLGYRWENRFQRPIETADESDDDTDAALRAEIADEPEDGAQKTEDRQNAARSADELAPDTAATLAPPLNLDATATALEDARYPDGGE
jgi:hypothetical protein